MSCSVFFRSVERDPKILAEMKNLLMDDAESDLELDTFLVAKSYFDLKEYDRCAFFAQNNTAPRLSFLHFYSRYLSGEKRSLDDLTDYMTTEAKFTDRLDRTYLTDLREEFEKLHRDDVSERIAHFRFNC